MDGAADRSTPSGLNGIVADLHVHSVFSDGELSPRQIIEEAKRLGLSAVALTDHDCVDGIDEAVAAGNEHGIEVIPAVELSATDGDKGVHVLGYFIDPSSDSMIEVTERLMAGRRRWAEDAAEKLKELRVENITLERVQEESKAGSVGKMHLKSVMVMDAGINENEAWRMVSRGGPAFVEKRKIPIDEAIEAIHNAGGIAVIAHPGHQKGDRSISESDIASYKAMGLDGIEVFYPKHNDEQIRGYLRCASRLDLCVTGGSDHHDNDRKPLGGCGLSDERFLEFKSVASRRWR